MYVHQVAEHRLRHVRLSSALPLILVLFVTSYHFMYHLGWLCSRVVSVLDSGAEGPGFKIAAATLSGDSFRQTVHTHRASVHQAAKLVPAYGQGR